MIMNLRISHLGIFTYLNNRIHNMPNFLCLREYAMRNKTCRSFLLKSYIHTDLLYSLFVKYTKAEMYRILYDRPFQNPDPCSNPSSCLFCLDPSYSISYDRLQRSVQY